MNRKTKAALKIAALVTAFALLIGVSVFFAGKTAYKPRIRANILLKSKNMQTNTMCRVHFCSP